MSRHFITLTSVALFLARGVACASAADVAYSGKLYNYAGTPQTGGVVRAGTFSPGNTAESWILANRDASGNVSENIYTAGVSSGIIVPITLSPSAPVDGTAGLDGSFVGVGTTSAATGTQIWLFGFPSTTTTTLSQVWATSMDPSWFVPSQPAGIASINTSTSTVFKFGGDLGDGIQLGILPFTEPNSLCLAACSALALGAARRRTPFSEMPAAVD